MLADLINVILGITAIGAGILAIGFLINGEIPWTIGLGCISYSAYRYSKFLMEDE